VFAEKFWDGFCRAIERPDVERDPRFASNAARLANRTHLIPLLETLFAKRTVHEWLTALHREGVPAAPINRLDQVLGDPQVRERQMVVTMAHPLHGALPALGTPIKLDGALGLEVVPAPTLGQHTGEILSGLLGYPDARLARLRREKIAA
jgi:crotonobetainyl-CoA:carnitine CoA-transferase CaiB-like acyl-CoA transferase